MIKYCAYLNFLDESHSFSLLEKSAIWKPSCMLCPGFIISLPVAKPSVAKETLHIVKMACPWIGKVVDKNQIQQDNFMRRDNLMPLSPISYLVTPRYNGPNNNGNLPITDSKLLCLS